jgi:hypothetical protein
LLFWGTRAASTPPRPLARSENDVVSNSTLNSALGHERKFADDWYQVTKFRVPRM